MTDLSNAKHMRPKFKTRVFILQPLPHPSRGLCKAAIDQANDGLVVRITEANKSRLQEEKYHAMIGDIARQFIFCKRLWDAEDMKRLLIDQFKRDTIKDDDFKDLWAVMGQIEMAPSIDGAGVVALGVQSKKFPKKLRVVLWNGSMRSGLKTTSSGQSRFGSSHERYRVRGRVFKVCRCVATARAEKLHARRS